MVDVRCDCGGSVCCREVDVSKVVLHLDPRGKLAGIDEKNERAYSRFRTRIEKLRPGETLSFEFRIPRSPRFHRLHFAMLHAIFECQEVYDDPEHMRKWLEVGAGHCDILPGPNGTPVAIPRSIAYEALDDTEFHGVHESIKAFLRSPRAYRYLWPHLTDERGETMAEAILTEFE